MAKKILDNFANHVSRLILGLCCRK